MNTKFLVLLSSCHPHTWGAALHSAYNIVLVAIPVMGIPLWVSRYGDRMRYQFGKTNVGRRPMYGSTYPSYPHRPRLTTSRRLTCPTVQYGILCARSSHRRIIWYSIRVLDIRTSMKQNVFNRTLWVSDIRTPNVGWRPMYGSTYPSYPHRPRLTTSRRLTCPTVRYGILCARSSHRRTCQTNAKDSLTHPDSPHTLRSVR